MIECDQTCPCADECANQRLQRGILPSVKCVTAVFRQGSRGMVFPAGQGSPAVQSPEVPRQQGYGGHCTGGH